MTYDIREKLDSVLFKIHKRRSSKGYSQHYMGLKMGISQNTFSKLELGKVMLTVERLLQIAEILNIEVNEFL